MQKLRYLRGAILLLAIASALGACGGNRALAPVGRPTDSVSTSQTLHRVRTGETLYAIAWKYGVDHRALAAWNGILAPYTIYPGQRLRVRAPSAAHKTPSSQASRNAENRATTRPGIHKREKKAQRRRTSAKDTRMVVSGWRWPTNGKVFNSFAATGRKGVDISGRRGQLIYAAAPGKVVYSGGGLRGYGKLIIIKHNQRYLSAYAHNNRILVKEGDAVKGGQRIAEMGRTEAERVMLHFQIRRDGKPVDPVRYLPRKAG